jgi:hypothetical protein
MTDCQGSSTPAPCTELGSTVTVLDSAGMPMCSATLSSSCGQYLCGGCGVFCVSGPGNCTFTATAPGFGTASTTLDLPSSRCAQPTSPTATLKLSPTCGTPQQHDAGVDGVGRKWTDCTPSSTWNSDEATAACTVYAGGFATGTPLQCQPAACSGDDAGAASAICYGPPESTSEPCTCWAYAGPAAGHVHHSRSGCPCASTSDPAWY